MPEKSKSYGLVPFLKTILLALVGFITSFSVVYKKLQELDVHLGPVGLLILTCILIIWLICIYLRFANFLKLSKAPFTPLFKNLSLIGIVAIPLLALGGWYAWKSLPPNKIIILVAEFAEKDNEKYRFGSNILNQLKESAKKYPDMEIIPLKFIAESQGRKTAIKEGQEQSASIVIWGSYAMPFEVCQISVYIEALRDPKILPMLLDQDTWTTTFTATKEEICEFGTQCKLAQEMSCMVLLSMGLARYKAEDFETSIGWFNEALKYANKINIVDRIKPCMIYLSIGNSYSYIGNLKEAINNFSKAINIDIKFALAYNNRGYIYNEQGEYDLALQDLNKAIDLNPELASSYNNRGFAYGQKKEYELAIKDHKKSIELEPSFAEAYNNLGYIYREKKDYDTALKELDKAIELDSKMAHAYCNRGYVYFKKNEYKQALHDLEISIKLDSKLAKAYYYRGLVFCKIGENIKGRTDLEKANQVANDPKLRELLQQKIKELDYAPKGAIQD